jgi:hypothetical protein
VSPPRRGVRTLRSFLFGGVVGGAIAVAAPRMRKRPPLDGEGTVGLRAFEGAPCWYQDHGRPASESEGYAGAPDGAPSAEG